MEYLQMPISQEVEGDEPRRDLFCPRCGERTPHRLFGEAALGTVAQCDACDSIQFEFVHIH